MVASINKIMFGLIDKNNTLVVPSVIFLKLLLLSIYHLLFGLVWSFQLLSLTYLSLYQELSFCCLKITRVHKNMNTIWFFKVILDLRIAKLSNNLSNFLFSRSTQLYILVAFECSKKNSKKIKKWQTILKKVLFYYFAYNFFRCANSNS